MYPGIAPQTGLIYEGSGNPDPLREGLQCGLEFDVGIENSRARFLNDCDRCVGNWHGINP